MFGLSLYTQERDLRDVFEHYGPIDDLQIVYDHQTGRSRGFAFIYMRNSEDAAEVSVRLLALNYILVFQMPDILVGTRHIGWAAGRASGP